jgi:hypothetical protein
MAMHEMNSGLVCEELGPGDEEQLLAFLEEDAVKNLRLVWAVRRWGLFNLGLAEQGSFLAARSGDEMRGALFRDNQGLWRMAAEGEAAMGLVQAALESWGMPEALAGRRVLLLCLEAAPGDCHRHRAIALRLLPAIDVAHVYGDEVILASELERAILAHDDYAFTPLDDALAGRWREPS